jgi:hypothetical protein
MFVNDDAGISGAQSHVIWSFVEYSLGRSSLFRSIVLFCHFLGRLRIQNISVRATGSETGMVVGSSRNEAEILTTKL